MTYLQAVVAAQIEELERDERVVLLGEDPSVYGGGAIVERFGESRVWSTPISEGGFAGLGIGAAITGMRPVVDLGIASFVYLASDQIINQASKLRYMTGGQVQVPIVFRSTMYYGVSIAAQHSDRPYSTFLNVPGLKVVIPSTPADAKGLLKAAIRDDDPVLFFEDTKLWPVRGMVPDDVDYVVPIGTADVKRAGDDVTIVGIAGAMRPCLAAAATLAERDVSVELIDPRSLKPLDIDTIIASVAKTGRLIIVENAHRIASASAEISAEVCEKAFDLLRSPITRITAPDIHVPFSPALEGPFFPKEQDIVEAVLRLR